MIKYLFISSVLICLLTQPIAAQQKDTTQKPMVFSGSLGLTNNGFSIIPSFSFNEPAALAFISWKKNKFSVDPEFRVTTNGKKGSILLWFRYHAIQGKRFSFRLGAHPAVNWFPTTVIQNGTSEEYLRLRRFIALEGMPSYRISKNWNLALYYLKGIGLQQNGPKNTHFVNLNSTISNIAVTEKLHLTINPGLFYLYLDQRDGFFFTAAASLKWGNKPFLVQSAINQKIRSSIPGTQTFMWNVGIAYTFSKVLK